MAYTRKNGRATSGISDERDQRQARSATSGISDERDQRQAGYGGEKEKATSPFSLPDRARRPPASIAPTDREPGIQPLVLF